MRTPLLFAAALAVATPAPAALNVFACEPEWAALVTELGGPDVDAYAATSALQDVHKIQPKPSLIARYRRADLVVCTGAELEIGWLPALAEKGNNPDVLPGRRGFFEASRFVPMREVPASVDRSMGDVHPFGNPHIQTNPANIAAVAKALAQRLAEIDRAHADAYDARYRDFDRRWTAALAKWQVRAAPLKDVAVVSHHRTWVYLYEWLGLTEVATLEPKPGIPPSAGHLEDVLDAIKARPVKMVIHSAYEDGRAAQWLSQQARIPSVTLPFSVGGAKGADDLFGLFDVTLERLLGALAVE